MEKRHVIVISVDAMVYEDLEVLSKLYALAPVWDRTARVNSVLSVYPSITYPAHTTMMTGVYPDRHGICANEIPEVCTVASPWYHFRSDVHAKTIFDFAKEHGYTTGAVYWPITGGDPSIDYLVDECWPLHGETSEERYRETGSSEEVIEKVIRPNLKHVENRRRQHPWESAFIMGCACDMMLNFKPDLLMIHPANIDAYRHETGLFSAKVTTGLYETNLWLAQLFKAVDDVGLLSDTDFFIVSDHGQMNIRRNVALNVAFAKNGLIDVGEDGRIRDYTAFVKAEGLSAHVYLKDPKNRGDYDRTYALLKALRDEEVYGVGQVFTEEETREKYHLGGPFSFVVESDGYTSFANDWKLPMVRPLDNRNYRFGFATHGHLPERGPQPPLVAFGPHIKPGVVLENARLVDEAPTFAHALGFSMPNIDGRVLTELFR